MQEVWDKLRGPEYERYFVQISKIHRTDKAMYLVMEYLASLRQYVEKHRDSGCECVNKNESVTYPRFVAQLVKGIGKMHALGLMHRNLKPENIFLSHDKDNTICLVIFLFSFNLI
jgi:serine/threonine-protein kinase